MIAVNLGVAVALLFANAFFVAVEFAVVASRRSRLEEMAGQGSAAARLGLASLRDLNLQLAGAQLGITMASLGLGAVAEPTLAHLIEGAIERFVEVPDSLLHTIGFVTALVIVVFLHMVVGEMIPKNVAIAEPERTLVSLAHLNRVYVTVFGPLLRFLNAIANAGLRAVGVEPRDELTSAASPEELTVMFGESRDEGLIEEAAHQLLTGALDLGDRPLESVLVPYSEVRRVSRRTTTAEAEQVVVDSGHTRLVVTDDGGGDVLGFVHAKDLLTVPETNRDRSLPLSRIRRMLMLDAGTSLDDAMVAMQRARIHLALVIGAEAEILGLATLEDVIEALVGDIRDESDR